MRQRELSRRVQLAGAEAELEMQRAVSELKQLKADCDGMQLCHLQIDGACVCHPGAPAKCTRIHCWTWLPGEGGVPRVGHGPCTAGRGPSMLHARFSETCFIMEAF